MVSAKTGEGVDGLYEAIVKLIPPPSGSSEKPLKALIFDSHYDPYRGVIVHFRIFEGSLKEGQEIMFMNSKAVYKVEEVGIFQLDLVRTKVLESGEMSEARVKELFNLSDKQMKTIKEKVLVLA